ncbi:amino acid ABC transporter permease [Paucilactobacillus sp. N302-9]
MVKKIIKILLLATLFLMVPQVAHADVISSHNQLMSALNVGNMHLQFGRIFPYKNVFLNGLLNTLKITAISLIGGTVLGVLLAMAKVSKIKILKPIAQVYTSIFRGTPLMVQLFLVYFATPQLFHYDIPAFSAAVITYSLNSGAYVSEILRGGIESVNKGQTEASLALGVSSRATMFDIVIPQALRSVLPALVNEAIALLKDSSLVATIGMLDLMRASQTAMNATYLAFEPFILVAIVYYILVMILTSFAKQLEKGMKKSA